ncbi:class I SAM-dependent methyltransferase family protein [Candidatus Micrarchaeota archaeon]|nr:class I SAM-dependent methyltransferase family protein [Candidatus Micrarchaeota archaeon]
MADFKKLLSGELGAVLSEGELSLLPSGYQALAQVAVLNLKPELVPKAGEIGDAFLELFPRFKTVCVRTGEITGTFREPQLKVVAGEPSTEVVVVENGVKYCFDCSRLMFAKGNVSERARLASLVRDGETVVDMFAGLGYFTLPIAVLAKPKRVYSIELNPVAFGYLNKNLALNGVEEKVVAINGDCGVEAKRLAEEGVRANRVVMGYLPAPKAQLPAALDVLKEGGWLHYEGVVSSESDGSGLFEDVRGAAGAVGRNVVLEHVQRVKSYGPKKEHVVLDCIVS